MLRFLANRNRSRELPRGRRVASTRLEPAALTAPGARATDPLHRSSRPEDLLGLSMLCFPRKHSQSPWKSV